MIKFLRTEIDNFMTFYGKYIIPMDSQGIVFIVGENKVSKMADSNGAGKTSIFDAISWCLYGKVLRNIEGVEVINYNAEQCSVIVIFNKGERTYAVVHERSAGFRTWMVHDYIDGMLGDPIGPASDHVEQILGLSYTAFCNVLLFGQSTRFAGLTDSQRKKVLDDLIDTAFFTEKRGVVEADVKVWRERVGVLKAELDKRRHGIELLQRVRDDALNAMGHSRSEQLVKDLEQEQEIRVFMEKMQEAIVWYLKLHRQSPHETLQLLNENERLLKFYNKKQDRLTHLLDHSTAQQRRALGSDQCPVCRQPVTERLKEDITAVYEKERWPLMIESIQLTHIESILRDWRIAFDDELTLWMHAKDLARQEFDEASEALAAIGLMIKREGVVLDDLDIQLDAEQRELLSHGQQLEQETLELTMREFFLAAFGPRGLKSLVLQDYEGFIQEKLNEYSGYLTANEVTITFSARRQLKSGEYREEITFDARNKFGARSYEGCSSGEQERIDLCLILALQDLVRELTQERIDLALYDEIFDHLDETGCDQVMSFLTEQRRQVGTVFVISHSPKLLAYPGDHTIRVVKTLEGSSLSME